MPRTRSQSHLLSQILRSEDTSEAALDQAVNNSAASLDSSSTYQPDSNSENKQDLAGKTDNTNMGQPMQYYQTPYGGYPVNQGTILLLHLNAPGPRPARLKIKFC